MSCHDSTNELSVDDMKEFQHIDRDFHYTSDAGEDLVLYLSEAVNKIKLSNGFGEWWFKPNSNAFTIPGKYLEYSGHYALTYVKEDASLEYGSIIVISGKAYDRVESFIGPKTVWPDGMQDAMVFSVPRDSFKNAIEDGRIVDYSLTTNQGRSESDLDTVNFLYSYMQFSGDRKSERILVGLESQDAQSREQSIDVVAHWPEKIDLSILEIYPFSDNRQRFKLSTNQLIDQFGNTVADGTFVKFILTHQNGSQSIHHGYTIEGKSTLTIPNPKEPGSIFIKACVGNKVCSIPLNIDFKSNVSSFKWRYDKDSRDLIVYDVIGALSQKVPDGTTVRFSIKSAMGESDIDLVTDDGACIYGLGTLPSGEYEIEITVVDKIEKIKLNI